MDHNKAVAYMKAQAIICRLPGEILELLTTDQRETLVEQSESEWKAMYGNARIAWPDIDSDDEWQYFWDCLSDHSNWVIKDLQKYISETFSIDFELYHYGRQGKTVAPSNYMTGAGNSFGSLDIDLDFEAEPYTDIQELRKILADELQINNPEYVRHWLRDEILVIRDNIGQLKNHLSAFQLLNESIRAEAAYIPKWWQEMKESNEWFEYDPDSKEELNKAA